MPRVSKFPLKEKIKDKIISLFLIGLAQVKNKTKARRFYEAIFTESEQVMLAKRFAVFYLLEKGVKQDKISSLLKMSPSSITRLQYRWRGLSEDQKKMFKKIMRNKRIKNLFTDVIKAYWYGSPLPPKYTNWKEWRKEKNKWEKDMEDPLR